MEAGAPQQTREDSGTGSREMETALSWTALRRAEKGGLNRHHPGRSKGNLTQGIRVGRREANRASALRELKQGDIAGYLPAMFYLTERQTLALMEGFLSLCVLGRLWPLCWPHVASRLSQGKDAPYGMERAAPRMPPPSRAPGGVPAGRDTDIAEPGTDGMG